MGHSAEYDEGAFVLLNDDNDDGDEFPDSHEDDTTVEGENDLVPLFVYTEPASNYLASGTLTLEAVSGTSKIKLWRYNDKREEITLPKTWAMSQVLGETFHIEGREASSYVNDVELKLTYACGNETSVDRVRLTVLQVQSVVWLGVNPGDGQTNLSDDNPASHGGGWRIFAEKNAPTGQLHDRVMAQATINVQMPETKTCKVYFQVFDMDDPTQNGTGNVVDTNDTATAYNGGDNKPSEPQGPGIGPTTGPEEATVWGGTSVAQLEYTITKRNPGNNFKIVAHCIPHYRGDVVIDTGAAKRGLDFKLGNSGPTVPATYKTPLLSVWRKLHTEVDSMGAPPPDPPWQAGDVAVADVDDPDTGLLVAAFEAAYTLPAFDTGNNNSNAGFIYNMTDAQAPNQGSNNRGTTAEAGDYWVAYIQGVYEGPTAEDNDDDTESGRSGYCPNPEPEYAFVYQEVIRDLCDLEHPTWDETSVERRTVIHEIGHQFELGHHDGCVMQSGPSPTKPATFCNSCLDRIRDIDSP